MRLPKTGCIFEISIKNSTKGHRPNWTTDFVFASKYINLYVYIHTFLHSWSVPKKLVVNLLHGATFLSNLTFILSVSFIGP